MPRCKKGEPMIADTKASAKVSFHRSESNFDFTVGAMDVDIMN